MTAAIELRTARLRELHASLVHWRGAIVANSEEWKRHNAALAGEKEAVLARHTALQATLARHRREHQERLRRMCVAAGQAQGEVQRQLEAARRVLQLAGLCTKFSLPQDQEPGASGGADVDGAAARVHSKASLCSPGAAKPASGLPGALQHQPIISGTEQQHHGDAQQVAALGNKDAGSGLSSGAAAALAGLSALGLSTSCAGVLAALAARTSRVELDKAALEQQKLQLAAENAALRGVLDSIEAGRTIRPDAVDGPLNTLLIVNGRLQSALHQHASG